jgi:hypothetical protein
MNTTTTLTSQFCPKAFEKAIASLNRKAIRLGLPEITYTLKGERTETKRKTVVLIDGFDAREDSDDFDVTVYDYEVSHLDIRQDGWELLGRISKDAEGGVFSDAFSPDFDHAVWEKRNPCDCDHCNTKRDRLFGWAVRNVDQGKDMLVGSSCAKLLMDGATATALEFAAHVFSVIFADFDDEVFEAASRSSEDQYCPVVDALALVEGEVEESGWKDNIRESCSDYFIQEGTHRQIASRIRHGQFALSLANLEPRHFEMAEAVRDELLEIETEDGFLNDLQYLLRKTYIPTRKLGLLCYTHKALKNHKAKAEEEELNASRKHFGEVGKRHTLKLTGVRVHSFDGTYGVTHINVFEDEERNLFVWKTGTMAIDEGEVYEIKVTVKEHSHFNGTPQTILTRCKWLNQPSLC